LTFFIRFSLLLRVVIDVVKLWLLPKLLLDGLVLTSSDSGGGNNIGSQDSNSSMPDPGEPDDDDPKDSETKSSEDSGKSESVSSKGSAEKVLTEDLAAITMAKQGNSDATDFLKEEYSSFFEGDISENQAINDIQEYLESEIKSMNNINSNGKRELEEDSEEENLKPKRIKFDNDDSNNNSGPSLGGSPPPTSSPTNGGDNSNYKIMHDIMYYFLIFISSIGESFSIIISNIM